MTFVLITSSGTMALAVNYGYRKHKRNTVMLLVATAALGATFVGMQAFEWTKLIMEGVRPWGNPWGAPQFGSCFFMITAFHGCHVSAGVIYLLITAKRVGSGFYDKKGTTRRSRWRACTGTSSTSSGVHLRVLLPVVMQHVRS
jgi:cytochrome c oxidase subunit 3